MLISFPKGRKAALYVVTIIAAIYVMMMIQDLSWGDRDKFITNLIVLPFAMLFYGFTAFIAGMSVDIYQIRRSKIKSRNTHETSRISSGNIEEKSGNIETGKIYDIVLHHAYSAIKKDMSDAELTKVLIEFRMSRAGVSAGLPESQAIDEAEEVVRQKVTNRLDAMSTPDGAIVANVATYLAYVGPVARRTFDIECPPDSRKFRDASAEAIRAIEAHRGAVWKGGAAPPSRFIDYIIYRTNIEVNQVFGVNSSEIGLDQGVIIEMVQICIEALGRQYEKNSDKKSF